VRRAFLLLLPPSFLLLVTAWDVLPQRWGT